VVASQLDLRDLRSLVGRVGGDVYCHAPADQPFDVGALDRPDDPEDRWSAAGTRTGYVAGDPMTALAEYARHGPPAGNGDERRIVRLRLAELLSLDLRTAAVRSALRLPPGHDAFIDRAFARSIALAIRREGLCQALVVPSMAFVDRPDRRNVVVFSEAVDGGLQAVLSDPREIGRIRLQA